MQALIAVVDSPLALAVLIVITLRSLYFHGARPARAWLAVLRDAREFRAGR